MFHANKSVCTSRLGHLGIVQLEETVGLDSSGPFILPKLGTLEGVEKAYLRENGSVMVHPHSNVVRHQIFTGTTEIDRIPVPTDQDHIVIAQSRKEPYMYSCLSFFRVSSGIPQSCL